MKRQSLESTVREAIEMLPVGSDVRVLLARAVNQTAKAKSKTPICFYCEEPILVGAAIPWNGKKFKPVVVCEDCAGAYRQASHEFELRGEVARQSFFDAAKMALCACGHTADDHNKDEMDNLLKCGASPRWTGNEWIPCTCQQFHYEVEDVAA